MGTTWARSTNQLQFISDETGKTIQKSTALGQYRRGSKLYHGFGRAIVKKHSITGDATNLLDTFSHYKKFFAAVPFRLFVIIEVPISNVLI
jgi:hypothetical protein